MKKIKYKGRTIIKTARAPIKARELVEDSNAEYLRVLNTSQDKAREASEKLTSVVLTDLAVGAGGSAAEAMISK